MKKTKAGTKSKIQATELAITDALSEDLLWNEEINEDISAEGESEILVYSRDWTIATIINQIEQKNIDLNPKFQRRNAWDDARSLSDIETSGRCSC